MSQKRFSREGFQPLTNPINTNMASPKDVTIDIPLIKVDTLSQVGARRTTDGMRSPSSYNPPTAFSDPHMNEKADNLRSGPAGLRRKMENRGRQQKVDEDGTLTAMGKIYDSVLNFSVITRYFLYVLPLALLIAVPIVLGAVVVKSASIGGVRIVWFFTWVEVIWLSLWCSKLVALCLPHLFQFLCGIISSGTRKYSLVLIRLEIPLSLVGWTLTSLTTFVPIVTLNPDNRKISTKLTNWESIVKDILLASFFSSLIFLVEKLLIQLLSISYHRKQFDFKIKDSKHNIFLLSLLYDASRLIFPAYCHEFAAEDYAISDSLDITGSHRNARSGASGSATPLRLIQDVGRISDRVTAAFGNVAQEITGKKVFDPTSAHSIVVQALERNRSSEALARRLWMSFVMEGKDALYKDDITEVLGPNRIIEADECFACLDRDGNGDVSLEEMILTVSEFGKERQSIANSMHDVDQAINVLDNMLCMVVFVAVVLVFVGFLNASFKTTLATAGAALLSLSFVIGTTAQEVLGSCIFLFVKHPFDVGDRVDIGDNQLTVEHISLLYTVFRKVKDHKTTQAPNIVLNALWIDNISRSNAMCEQISLYINFETTLEDIQLLKSEMAAFVVDNQNSRDFQPDVDLEITGISEMNKLELRLGVRHKSNWANETVRAARCSKLMCALVLALRKVPIYGPGAGGAVLGDVSMPAYSVAISHEEAEANKKAFGEKKDQKRLIPVVPDDGRSEPAPSMDGSSKSAPVFETSGMESLRPQRRAVESIQEDENSTYSAEERTAGERATAEKRRSNDLAEVRDLLRQDSLQGKRRGMVGVSISNNSGPELKSLAPPPRIDSKQKLTTNYEEDTFVASAPRQEMISPTLSQQSGFQTPTSSVKPIRTMTPSQSFSPTDFSGVSRRPVPGNAYGRPF